MLMMVTDTELRERDRSATMAASSEHTTVGGPRRDSL